MWRALARTGTDPAAEGPADRVDNRVSAVTVQRELAVAIAGLPAGDRDVLLLIAWADLSYDEVAAALDIPIGDCAVPAEQGSEKDTRSARRARPYIAA